MKLTLTHNSRYVNAFPRLIAVGIDQLVLSIISVYFLDKLTGISLSALLPALLQTMAYVLIPINIGYRIGLMALLSATGYTPGKWLCGIQILNEDEKPLGMLATIIRESLAKRVSEAVLMAGYIAALVNPDHQTWHDQLVSSFAYKRTGNLTVGVMLFIVLAGVEGQLLYSIFLHLQANTPLQQDLQFLIEPLAAMVLK